ncbi:pyridine nucleotide-disulfide oxidoreductase [Labedella gwakjiensis]|uniref:NAD(P)/FAD-dependent oxidoreductase n=1 Tax=Labedella gwakjiensis TaxID=390269 RepID=A0A2P8GX75_9MICO|nr:FAD/NAD(P)-binding oxidoreductase [Labedella gwakjiensis]PSL38559.1 pyridine nucleotide-disulfide oxidoreductase [Labedella gwakjiensis]RUQ86934.1 NAD(P)/FAD-dependent oxidoreductase [Labedella gwakjiensis]
MDTPQYLIIGGGMVADSAARGIREVDEDGSIVILSADVDEPYTRPALSKKLWTDDEFTWDKVPLGTAEATGADIRLETEVTAIDREARTVTTAGGDTISYEKLLLATGGAPRTLDGESDDRVIAFRSASDYHALRKRSGAGVRAVVVGGGYIGQELAAALVQNETEVTLVTPDETLGGSAFPADLAHRVEDRFRAAGITVRPGRRVESVSIDDHAVTLRLDDGTTLDANVVVTGLGVTPVTGIAEAAGLAVDDGIVVDERLRTADENIWAAGDVASYPDAILGRTRVEHVDNAEQMGRAAGRSIAGADEAYTHTPSFYSDVFEFSWEAVGTLDASLETIEDWTEELESGVVYYLEEGRPVGVLLWRTDGGTDEAREVLANPPADAADLIGRIRPGAA